MLSVSSSLNITGSSRNGITVDGAPDRTKLRTCRGILIGGRELREAVITPGATPALTVSI